MIMSMKQSSKTECDLTQDITNLDVCFSTKHKWPLEDCAQAAEGITSKLPTGWLSSLSLLHLLFTAFPWTHTQGLAKMLKYLWFCYSETSMLVGMSCFFFHPPCFLGLRTRVGKQMLVSHNQPATCSVVRSSQEWILHFFKWFQEKKRKRRECNM